MTEPNSESIDSAAVVAPGDRATEPTPKRRSSRWGRFMILIRRVHLYSGLFLLPWVFLYGITGAMFNHQGLFPEMSFHDVDDAVLAGTEFANFPAADELAEQVVQSLQRGATDRKITLAAEHGAEFTGDLMFETHQKGTRHIVHLDPVSRSSYVANEPKNPEQPEGMLTNLRNIKLQPDPQKVAQESAATVLKEVGIQSHGQPRPLGWTKLNFLVSVDDEPARVTYVLKDGHVDITRFSGEDGMTTRHFFMRLHTTHGQPPHWNGRMFWILAADTMAVSMVCWAVTGILMWWQIKRTRLIGGIVIGLSILTATLIYFGVHDFYAATKL